MRRIKAVLLFLVLSPAFLLSGCLSPVQLNRQAIVQGVGIDYKDGNYRLTFQIFSPSGSSGGSNIGASADNAKTITAEGKTVSEAIQNGVRGQGKKLFIGQNRVIILGMEAAKHDLAGAVAYLGTNPTSRQSAHILISRTTAEEILTAKINQGILPAEALEHMTENARENGIARSVRLFELRKTLFMRHESAAIPLISYKESEKPAAAKPEESGGSKETIEQVSPLTIGKTALFWENTFRGELDERQTRGMMWVRDEIEKTAVQVPLPSGGSADVLIYRADTKLALEKSTPYPVFSLVVRCKATKGEIIGDRNIEQTEEARFLEMEQAAQNVIKEECEAAFSAGVQNFGCDFLNFGNILWQNDMEQFQTLLRDWNGSLKGASLHTEVTVEIERVGMSYEDDR